MMPMDPHPRQDRAVADRKAAIVILQRARDTVRGSNLSAEDALDMLIKDEAAKLRVAINQACPWQGMVA